MALEKAIIMTVNDTQKKHIPDTLEEYVNSQYKEHLKQPFVAAFGQLGFITPACKKVGISRSTFYRWLYNDDYFLIAVLEAFNALYKEKGDLLEQIPLHKRHQLFQMREDMEG